MPSTPNTLAAALVAATLAAPAGAVVLDLSWTGQFAGFTLEGQMAVDEGAADADGVVRSDGFTDFDWALFDAEGALIRAFEDDHLSEGFNANYDTATGELLQSDRWDGPGGLNLGDPRGEGLNLWSIGNPLDAPEVFNPHLHVTDWLEEFPQFPVQFGNEVLGEGHIDGAFFRRTASEITGDPADGDALGQRIEVAPVPLPAGGVLLAAALGLLGLRRAARG